MRIYYETQGLAGFQLVRYSFLARGCETCMNIPTIYINVSKVLLGALHMNAT